MLLDRIRHVFEHPGPYLTIHAEVGKSTQNGHRQLDARWTTLRHELEDQAVPTELVEDLERRLREVHHLPGEVRRTLVVAGDEVVLDELHTGHALWPETFDRGELPDLSGWLRAADREVPFLLVQVDRTGGDLDFYRAADTRPEHREVEGAARFYITKVPQGDWAQSQYQRGAEENWKHNAQEVADAVASVVREKRPRLLLVAGDVRAVQQLTDVLPDLPTEVVRLESGGRAAGTSEQALNEEIQRVLAEHEARHQQQIADQLAEASGRGQGEAAVGVRDVLDAFVRGQVDTLVLDLSAVTGERVHPGEFEGLVLPSPAADAEELPADRVLLAAAALSDAQVAVLPAELVPTEPVAALLRWAQ